LIYLPIVSLHSIANHQFDNQDVKAFSVGARFGRRSDEAVFLMGSGGPAMDAVDLGRRFFNWSDSDA